MESRKQALVELRQTLSRGETNTVKHPQENKARSASPMFSGKRYQLSKKGIVRHGIVEEVADVVHGLIETIHGLHAAPAPDAAFLLFVLLDKLVITSRHKLGA